MSRKRRLGLWVFVAVELLLFGGLLGTYLYVRSAHPAAFAWSHRLLDPNVGALGMVILLAGSLTMAGAVHYAHRAKRRRLVFMLGLTLLAGSSFLAVKAVEYTANIRHGVAWGQRFKPDRRYLADHLRPAPRVVALTASTKAPAQAQPKTAAAVSGDAERGKPVFQGTCAACHGMQGVGIKSQGANLVASEFVGKKDDAELLAFVKKGRQPFDSDSTMHLSMPARGGNPILTDQNLLDAIAFIRDLRKAAAEIARAPKTTEAAVQVAAVPEIDPNAPQWVDGAWRVPRSIIPAAAAGPSGLKRTTRPVIVPPPDANVFFGLFFLTTGIHGVFVLAGMGFVGLLLVRTLRGQLAPVDFGGVYWHLLDGIWLVLFPLFYLMV